MGLESRQSLYTDLEKHLGGAVSSSQSSSSSMSAQHQS